MKKKKKTETDLCQIVNLQAWKLWNEKRELEFVDSYLLETCSKPEILRCMHIGLLCVQEDPSLRPTMSSVVAHLESDPTIPIPEPGQPAIPMPRIVHSDETSTSEQSLNHMTTSTISGR